MSKTYEGHYMPAFLRIDGTVSNIVKSSRGERNRIPKDYGIIKNANIPFQGASKPVHQHDKSGKFIKTFKSATDAERETGINKDGIGRNCRGASRSAGGFVWSFIKEFMK